jgi:hypothetical protein
LHQGINSPKVDTAGTQIWITKGIYQPQGVNGLYAKPSLSLFGGFTDDGSGASLNDRNFNTNSTIVQAYQKGAHYILNVFSPSETAVDNVTVNGIVFVEGRL